MSKALFTSLFLLVVATSGFSQAQTSRRFKITYDPILWKKELKLKPEQCERISSINASFYEAVLTAGKERKEKEELEQLMLKRSEDLWNLFSVRQRKKWQKLQSTPNQRA